MIDWDSVPFEIQTKTKPWAPIDGRRIGGVSSFGFSGTNAHLIVEGTPPQAAPVAVEVHAGQHLFVLSANSESALAELALRYVAALDKLTDKDLEDFCFTAAISRASFPYRAAMLTRSVSALRGQLEALASRTQAAGLRTARVGRRDPPRIAFLFTGQGAQYAGMAASLDKSQPVFRAALNRCAAVLDARLERPLRDVLFPAPGETSPINDTAYTQPALFSVEYALAELLRHWGVSPDMVMGHSVGEYVAACIAGVMSLEDALVLVAERGRLMQSLPPGGAMAAVFTSEAEVARTLSTASAGSVSIAALNGPAQTVISGAAAAVQAASDAFSARGVRCEGLHVSHAFHSSLVDPILDRFEKAVARVDLAAPTIRFVSNLTGALADARDVVSPAYWRRHVREPVRFVDGVRKLAGLDPQACIEIGPQPVLLSLVQEVIGEGAAKIAMIPTLRRSRPDADQLAEALASLYLAGASIDWRAVWSARPRQLLDLPTYPFQRERFWFAARAPQQKTSGRDTGNPLLGVRLRSAAADLVSFESSLGYESVPFLRDHQVGGRAILPGTGFIEMGLAAGQAVFGQLRSLQDIVIAEPLVVGEGETRIVQVLVRRDDDGGGFEILSTDPSADDSVWRRHVQGRFGAAPVLASVESVDAIRNRCVEPKSAADHYAELVSRGFEFGPSLQGLRAVKRRDGEALGEVVLPDAAGTGSYLIHPALLDACLQVVSAALPSLATEAGRAYLPLAINSIQLFRSTSDQVWSHVSIEATGSGGALRGEVQVFDKAGPVARLQGITFVPVAMKAPVDDTHLYRTVWEPRTSASSAWTPAPTRLAHQVSPVLNRLFSEHDLDSYDRGFRALESWCAAWIIRALNELGWTPAVGSHVAASGLATTLGVAPRYERQLGRFMQILVEERLLAPTRDGWSVKAPLTANDPAHATSRLLAEHPSSRARITLAANCGAELAGILRGEVDPLARLFPGGSTELAEALYRDAPEAKAFNQLVRETVRDIASNIPARRRMRVLEVGGGTGGTTAWVAPVLADKADYLFTDIGPSMVARARTTFAGFPFIDFKVFDLERDPGEQGIAAGYDLILASNVIHATADLGGTLARLRSLLAPGGILLMLEVAGDERWIDVTFGLTEGWWRFTDAGLRKDSPLLSRKSWLALLDTAGFEGEALNPADARTREVLLAARKPVEGETLAPGDWVILADATGVGEALAARINTAGGTVHTIRNAADLTRLPPDLKGVIHLRTLDLPRLDDGAIDAVAAQQERSLGSLLEVVQALGRATFAGAPPRLWIAARGGQAVDDLAPVDPAQAPVWGMSKTIALEHTELRSTAIDLDPAATPHANAAALFDCLVTADAEDQIAVRNGVQYVARLTKGAGAVDRDAVRLEARDSGVIDDLRLVPVGRRAPGPDEVEIRIAAGGLNFRDVMNAVAMRDDPEPLGGECAGRIVAVGEGVRGFAVGDHVVGLAEASFATYARTSASLVAKIPDGIDFAEAVTLPFCFMTAYHALTVLGRLAPGETVLIHAGAGGVGTAAIQIAQGCGARVIATAGSDEKRAYLRSLGVEAVFNSRDLAFADGVLKLTGGRGADLVLNSLAGEFIAESVRCLSPEGRFLEIGKRDIWSNEQFRAERPSGAYFAIDLAAMRNNDSVGTEQLFALVLDKVRKGEWKPLPLARFPLARAAEAFRFMAQARHIGKVVLVENDLEAATTTHVRRDGAYLVTGGLGGLGLLTAQRLVRRGATTLTLVGRRAPSEGAKAAIAAMEKQGANVTVMQADMAEPHAVAKVLAAIKAGPVPLRGVVHSAGALHDGALLQQSWDRFTEPLGAKVDGAWALHALTRHARLDFFIMYSSIASVLGSAGQANHAAANAFMDALALHRRAEGLPGLSISWGAWKEIGAAADRNLDDRVGARGIGMIAPEQGLLALEQLSGRAAPHVAFFPVQWDVFFKGASPSSPFLSEVGTSPVSTPVVRKTAAAASAPAMISAELQAATPARRRELLLAFAAEHVASVIGAPDWRGIDPRQPLNELGLDSLMAVDLRNRLGAGLGVGRSLPATLVFDHPTIEALATYLARGLSGVEEVAPVSAKTSEETIDDLSEEEIERLFAERTRTS
jgi:acyl transferase domain-containing protein